MKIALCAEHHYPGYGGPYTAVSDTAYQLYKSNVGIKLIYENNGHSFFKRDYHEIFQNVDLIHAFGIWTPAHYRVFKNAKKAKKKIIISPLGSTEPWSMEQKKIKKKIAWYLYQKRVLQNCSYLHATSDLEKKHLIDLGITTPIRVIPHGIKIPKLSEKKINKKIKKALFFSRIHEKKGLLELIESWKEVNNTKWILEIYGPISDQKYFQSVVNTIKKYNLEHYIKIYKPYFDKKKKEEILKSADCFLLPSKSENFGMSIIEALSYGLPVLTTTETPWKKLEELNAGIIFEFYQNNLTKNLRKILNMSSDELLLMGEVGRNFIKKHYDLEEVIHQYVDFYKEVFDK